MDYRVATFHAMTNQSASAWHQNLRPRILTRISKKAYFSENAGRDMQADQFSGLVQATWAI
jgi:hypothetical protein